MREQGLFLRAQLISLVHSYGVKAQPHICGICRTMLVENIVHGQVGNIVLKCPKCGAYNEIPWFKKALYQMF